MQDYIYLFKMNVDLNDIDDKLKQISPNELDHLQQATMDAKSAEGTVPMLKPRLTSTSILLNTYCVCLLDDIAIAEAISQIEAELNEDETAHRTSIFDSEGVDVDLNGIDANLQQITPKEHAFDNQQKNDQISAEGKT